MRKSKKTKATYDAIGSLDPTEAGEILSTALGGNHDFSVDWKNHEYEPGDIYIGDPPNTLGGGSILGSGRIGDPLPLGGTTISPSINPSVIIGGPGSTTTVDGVVISDLEKRVRALEEEVKDLRKKVKKGGFRGKPRI